MSATIAIQTFNTEELLTLLKMCSMHLVTAYQKTEDTAMAFVAEEAFQAYMYLAHEFEKQQGNLVLH